MSRRTGSVALLCAVGLAAGCGAETGAEQGDRGAGQVNRVVATGLSVPWGIAFLPGGDALVGERTTGRILRVSPGGRKRVVRRLAGVDTTEGAGEGGLLGLAVSPAYRRDRWVYAYYTSARDNRIVRFRLSGRVRPLVTGIRRAFNHNGGRIAFGPDGKLYAGVGDAESAGVAQSRRSRNGKILRMNPNGSVPGDNPFGNLVWSWGHRNVQGLAWDSRGRLWATEFGQSSFDEVNLIRRGGNYGWPEVEGRGSTAGGRFVNPKVTWRTSDASPSGAAIRRGTMYIGALQGQSVLRLRLSGTRASKLSPLLRGAYGRIRTVQRAPDGSLWVSTSNRDGRGDPRQGDDRLIRLR